MSTPLALSVWVFAQDVGAQRAVHPLARPALDHLRIADVGVVCWPHDRPRPIAWQGGGLVDEQRLSGAFWGLLISSLFLLPLAGAPGGGDEAESHPAAHPPAGLPTLGLEADFAASVQAAVVPGTSALLVVDGTEDADALAQVMPADARRVVQQPLTVEQTARLYAAFGE